MTSFLPPEDLIDDPAPPVPPPDDGSLEELLATPTVRTPNTGEPFNPYPHQEADIEVFMQALRQFESGDNYEALGKILKDGSRARGAYQIMDKFWAGWAAEAGLSGADWRDPAAQDAVARYKITKYFRELGDWRLVMTAWFAGLGTARIAQREGFGIVGRRQDANGTSVTDYIGRVMGLMEEIKPGSAFPDVELPPMTGPLQPASVIQGPGFQFNNPLDLVGRPLETDDPDALTGRAMLTTLLSSMSNMVRSRTNEGLVDTADVNQIGADPFAPTDLRSAPAPEGLP